MKRWDLVYLSHSQGGELSGSGLVRALSGTRASRESVGTFLILQNVIHLKEKVHTKNQQLYKKIFEK